MAVEVRGKRDEIINQIEAVLESYQKDHQEARIAMYRRSSASVRIRIIDPYFVRMSKADRNDYVWSYLDRLSDDSQGDISMLLLLAPSEVKKDFANIEFEDPVPSMLSEHRVQS